jgi:SSS family solute:Na+ symporter
MAVSNWEWLVFPAQGLLLFFFLPVYLANRIFTIPEYLTRRFGRLVGSTFALVCMVQYLVINLPLVLYSGGFVVHRVFGLDLHLAIGMLVLAAGSYTVFGGLSAVAWVDLFNGALLIVGGLVVFVLGVLAVPGGLPAIVGTGDRAHLMLPADHPELPWTGMLAVAFVMSGYYYSTNQFITQRCLGAKTVWDGEMGVVLAGFLAIPLGLAVTWPGMIAYALNPGLDHPDAAYPYLIGVLIPVGLRGLVFAFLIGAIMSTLDSLVNSTSSLLTLDLYKGHIRRDASDHHLVRFAQLSGVGILLFGALWSPMVGRFGSIFSYAQDCWALMLAPVMAVFVLALFWRRTSRTAAIVVLFSSFPMLLIVFLRELLGLLADHNIFNLSAVVFLISLGVGVLISLLTPDPAPPAPRTLWSPRLLRQEASTGSRAPLWRRVGLWYALLVGCFVVIYAVFW